MNSPYDYNNSPLNWKTLLKSTIHLRRKPLLIILTELFCHLYYPSLMRGLCGDWVTLLSRGALYRDCQVDVLKMRYSRSSFRLNISNFRPPPSFSIFILLFAVFVVCWLKKLGAHRLLASRIENTPLAYSKSPWQHSRLQCWTNYINNNCYSNEYDGRMLVDYLWRRPWRFQSW